MTPTEPRALFAVLEATWPAHSQRRLGAWTLRDGQGGGKRASAASVDGGTASADLGPAEAEMRRIGMRPLFMVRGGQGELDRLLEGAGYEVVDPVNIYLGAVNDLARGDLPPGGQAACYRLWPPMAIQREIWAEGGIGPARVSVMARVQGDRTALLARLDGRAAAAAFVARAGDMAMIHAIEVRPAFRRRGAGRAVMREAARWAAELGSAHLAVVCTAANAGANALYRSMEMHRAGHYHYRQHPQAGPQAGPWS